MRSATLNILSRVHQTLINKELTVSVAESCTGGLVSHLLTKLPGSSAFFEAGIVSYSRKSKEQILGISRKIITRQGVVSERIAKEMAEKIRALTNTDFSVATTGNLGPAALEGKDKGLIYIAVSCGHCIVARELRLDGEREANKKEAALQALKLLLEVISPA
jgi:PncC family amidohydrolase